MSHTFCGKELACPSMFPNLGWNGWSNNSKAVYIRTTIDNSVIHRIACGQAIANWNSSVGTRFLLIEDVKGEIKEHVGGQITFFEKNKNEWPFNNPEWFINGKPAAGFALNYDEAGTMLGTSPGRVARSDIFINSDTEAFDLAGNKISLEFHNWWAHFFAHEIGHSFGLDDHPNDNINSVMSYQSQGLWLFGPSLEDTQGIARIYGLEDIEVKPQDLEGIENIESIWYFDRYGKRRRYFSPDKSRWSFFSFLLGLSNSPLNDLYFLEAYESYLVKAKQPGQLGFGRFSLPVLSGQHFRWVFL